jgi:hypothetical protein
MTRQKPGALHLVGAVVVIVVGPVHGSSVMARQHSPAVVAQITLHSRGKSR